MNGKNLLQEKQGFTLIELLVVIGILGVMMSLGLLVWSQTAPAVRLDGAIQAIQSNLTYARNGAIQTNNDWFVHFDINNHTYYIANDDGWLGTVTAIDQFGRKREPRGYYLGSPDFDTSMRNNGILDDINANGIIDVGDFELVRGPFGVGKELFFMRVNNQSVTRVTFDREGKPSFTFHSGSNAGGGVVWVAAARYYEAYPTDPNGGTKDNQRYRKAVKIRAGTGIIVVTENY